MKRELRGDDDLLEWFYEQWLGLGVKPFDKRLRYDK